MRNIILSLAFIVNSHLFANHPLWLRYPSISPDGKNIVFDYKGDIYKVLSNGGTAVQLTNTMFYEFRPIWSPDNNKIVFASNEFGNFDIFLLDIESNQLKRLTTHSADEYPTSFSPDGKYILFTSTIQPDPITAKHVSRYTNTSPESNNRLPDLYKVSINGGRPIRIFSTPTEDAKWNSAQTKLIYHDVKGSKENKWRKHHQSSVASDIWLYNNQNKQYTKLTSFEGEDRSPCFSADENSVFYLSEQFGSFNVCSLSVSDPGKIQQITFHEKHPVRLLSVDNTNTLCYSYNGEIYIKKNGKASQKVRIEIQRKEKSEIDTLKLSSGASEFALSPSGKEIAVVLRGNIFVIGIPNNTIKQLTNTPEEKKNISFSPDGRTLIYASEREGSWKLYKMSIPQKDTTYFYNSTSFIEEPLLSANKDTDQPKFSPNGDQIAFIEDFSTLRILDLNSNKVHTILNEKDSYSFQENDQSFQWLPNGKWIAKEYHPYNFTSPEIGLIKSDTQEKPVNITNSGFWDEKERVSNDGRMLVWLSNRNGMRNYGSSGSLKDIYFTELDVDKQTDNVKPIIDNRITRITKVSGNISDILISPDNQKVFFLSQNFNDRLDLNYYSLKDKKIYPAKELNISSGSLAMTNNNECLYIFSNGKILQLDTVSFEPKEIKYQVKDYVNTQTERAYIFNHICHLVKKRFYDDKFHNTDWKFYNREYEKFLLHINNNYDFAELINEMLGELNASHCWCSFRPNKTGDETASLGILYDLNYEGEGIKVSDIIENGPCDNSKSHIKPGIIITEIEGVAIKPTMDFFPLLNHKAYKNIQVSLFNPLTSEKWTETIRPINHGHEIALLYDRWVNRNRELTEKLSNGKIGYFHIIDMNDYNYRDIVAKSLSQDYDKEAIIIDTRYDNGGWIHDDLIDFLRGIKYASFERRNNAYGIDPLLKWTKKSAVIVSEANYSNAFLFPYYYQKLNLGKVIGTPVPASGSVPIGENQIDPTLSISFPQLGIKNSEGKFLENVQLEPDLPVFNNPAALENGEDQQLIKTIETLMHQIE
ncbi:MAG TPA: S41 family peptidase [Bacteroidales bacterium]